jgi:aminopeptidase N
LIAPDGSDYPLQLDSETAACGTTRVLNVTAAKQSFRFVNVPQAPAVSPLRGFSAPVKLHQTQQYAELAFLFAHDSDEFNRWNAGQQLASRIILQQADCFSANQAPLSLDANLLEAYRKTLGQDWDDLSYLALLLTLPSEDYVGALLSSSDPVAIHHARQTVKRELAQALRSEWLRWYQTQHKDESGQNDAGAIGRRAIKNVCLGFLSALDTPEVHALCIRQFEAARNMTDQIAALSCLVNTHAESKSDCLDAFYRQWQDEALVIDKWFSIQASCSLPGTLDNVLALLEHPAFDLKTPNRARSLIGAFSQSNPVNFHALDGGGYRFLGDQIVALNALNPQIASRLLGPLTQWRRFDQQRQALMRAQLQRIADNPAISKDVYEVASKILV